MCSLRYRTEPKRYMWFKWPWLHPLIQVRGSCSHRSKTQMKGQKEEDTTKKGKMGENKVFQTIKFWVIYFVSVWRTFINRYIMIIFDFENVRFRWYLENCFFWVFDDKNVLDIHISPIWHPFNLSHNMTYFVPLNLFSLTRLISSQPLCYK